MKLLTRKQFMEGISVSATSLALSSFLPNTFAASELQTAESIRDAYLNSEEFLAYYNANPEEAMDMLEKIIKQLTEISPVACAYDETYSVNTTLVQQTNSDTCGPASAYMAIYGFGQASSIVGTTTTAKIDQLADEMGTDSSGTYVYKLTQVLNNYVAKTSTASYVYDFYQGKIITQTDFCNCIAKSLGCGRIPILHARTQELSYYNGHASGHYIAISQFNGQSMTLQLKDPNNQAAYYGTKTVSVEEAFASINNYTERYLIAYGG